MVNILTLILAFLITFFMVGFCFVEIFFPKIIFRIKFPLYIVSSLVISTFLVYITALGFGLNRFVVLITLFPFLPLSIFFTYKLRYQFLEYFRSNYKALLFIALTILVYFLVLNPAILARKDDYLVMSGVNWQDTALHFSITQSLTQGNFPPQAPYFSGAPLSYYYFSDFHSAIINIFYGKFFPRVFVYDNAILAGVLALTIYSLAFEVSKNKKLSLISSFLGTFYGSFIFYKFFVEIINGGKLVEILANNTFSMEYGKIFGMANMADYYLQNRPMMVGLPIVITIILLGIYGYKKENLKSILLAGILCASLVKFQLFCLIAGGLAVFIISISAFKIRRIKFITKLNFIFRSYLSFLIPVIIFYIMFGTRSINGTTFYELVKNTFHFGPWDNTQGVVWYAKFLILNLGLPFLITLLALFKKSKTSLKSVTILSLLFVVIPCLLTFTIAESDMIKFFYFGAILFCVVTPYYLYEVIKNKFMFYIIIILIIFASTASSFLTLTNSYLNKNTGYSLPEYNVGEWIRNNTPEKSVFVTMPTVHSAPSDFGGRLRVISYTNWPYTHGFNVGSDNVFSRASDVENVFKTGDINNVKLKYNAQYIYYGSEERSGYPDSQNLFDANLDLKKVYDLDNINIYRIIQ